MRHSEPSLTVNSYLDEQMLPLKQSVEMLPALNDTQETSNNEWIHIWTPFEDGNGQNTSFTVASNALANQCETFKVEGFGRELSHSVAREEKYRRWDSNPHSQGTRF